MGLGRALAGYGWNRPGWSYFLFYSGDFTRPNILVHILVFSLQSQLWPESSVNSQTHFSALRSARLGTDGTCWDLSGGLQGGTASRHSWEPALIPGPIWSNMGLWTASDSQSFSQEVLPLSSLFEDFSAYQSRPQSMSGGSPSLQSPGSLFGSIFHSFQSLGTTCDMLVLIQTQSPEPCSFCPALYNCPASVFILSIVHDYFFLKDSVLILPRQVTSLCVSIFASCKCRKYSALE